MPAAQNQDFLTYVGDAVTPIFTVVAADGKTPVDISAASDIKWQAQRNLQSPAALSKSKVGGQITFVNSGTDGKFQVPLLKTDTAALSGWYMHTATVLDAVGNPTTVTIGRMDVGVSPNWTWDPGSVGTITLYTVRRLIGDTVQSDQLLSDQEILWAIGQYSNEWLAAAECCRDIAAGYARQVDLVTGQLKTNYSQRAKTYRQMSIDLEQRGMARGGVSAYVGGISITDKTNNQLNTDAVPPQFLICMWDNLLPEGSVGHQTQSEALDITDMID